MIDAHPALKAVSPQARSATGTSTTFCTTALLSGHAYRWLGNNDHVQGKPTGEKLPPVNYPNAGRLQAFSRCGNDWNISRQYLKDASPFWKEMMAHPNRDEFWQKRDLLPHLKNVAPAVMVVTGWYDAEDLYGSFKTYQAIEKQNPKVNNVLVVGPWHHGGWASVAGDKLGPFRSAPRRRRFTARKSSCRFSRNI